MTSGKHLIADIFNITNPVVLATIDGVEPLMKKIIEVGKLNVIGETKQQFHPYGATILYLLSESHLSIHTYPERNYCAIDLYCCNPMIDMAKILEVIYTYFNGDCNIIKKIIDR
jgi:S-adenosylmethionine decarboxylase